MQKEEEEGRGRPQGDPTEGQHSGVRPGGKARGPKESGESIRKVGRVTWGPQVSHTTQCAPQQSEWGPCRGYGAEPGDSGDAAVLFPMLGARPEQEARGVLFCRRPVSYPPEALSGRPSEPSSAPAMPRGARPSPNPGPSIYAAPSPQRGTPTEDGCLCPPPAASLDGTASQNLIHQVSYETLRLIRLVRL